MAGGHENLRVPTSEQARINGAKGGSSPKKAATIKAKQIMRALLSCKPYLNDKTIKQLKGMGIDVDDETMTTNYSLMEAMLLSQAQRGDIKARDKVRETAGMYDDPRYVIELEKIKLERERLALERERLAFEKSKETIQVDEEHPDPVVSAFLASHMQSTIQPDVPEDLNAEEE